MRSLIWYLLLLAVAVVVAILFQDHSGNVLIIAQPWRIELSLSLAIVIIILLFFIFHWLLKASAWIGNSPSRLRSWRNRRSDKKDMDLIEQSWLNNLQGNYIQSEKDLANLITRSKSPKRKVLALLNSAKSLHLLGETKRRDMLLAQAKEKSHSSADLKLATAVVNTKILLDTNEIDKAIATISPFADNSSKAVFANRLLLRAYIKLGDDKQVLELSRKLIKSNAIDKKQAHKFIVGAVDRLLASANENEYKEIWGSLKSEEKLDPAVALAGAKAQTRFDNPLQAAQIMQAVLKTNLDENLLHYYAHCTQEQASRRLGHAEVWLKNNPNNPDLLASLGQLCLVAHLWGQAKHYLERSLAIRPDVYIHALLGSMHDVLGESDKALSHWRLACAAAEAEIPAIQRLLPPADVKNDPHFDEAINNTVEPTDDIPMAASAVYTQSDDVVGLDNTFAANKADSSEDKKYTDEYLENEYFDTAPIPGVDMSQTSDRSQKN